MSLKTLSEFDVVSRGASDPVRVFDLDYLVWQVVITLLNPQNNPVTIAAAGWNAATNLITKADFPLLPGTPGILSTSGGLPAGSSGDPTVYYIGTVGMNPGTFKLYPTYDDAIAGTNELNFTTAGTGSHTFTPLDLATATVRREGSVDGVHFKAIPDTSQEITGAATFLLKVPVTDYPYERIAIAADSGVLHVAVSYDGKGE